MSVRLSIVVLAAAATSSAFASPARMITSPPVIKGANPNTGPPVDPLAMQGQWFLDNATGTLEVRPWEFYDNNDVVGSSGSQMIRGAVANVMFDPLGVNITGFAIRATISNDLPGVNFPGQPGRNRHEEQLFTSPNFQGTMFDVKMTAEFAFPSRVVVPVTVLNQIAANAPPYAAPDYGGGQVAAIIAQNEDEEAWYSFTPTPIGGTGGFFVPTYDFGNIAPGASVSRTLNFAISGAGLPPAHPLFGQLLLWMSNQSDVLMNRTTDLKIGDWVDVLALDTGAPYPVPAFTSGNVSVFFNIPEPTALAALMPVGLLALRRRRIE